MLLFYKFKQSLKFVVDANSLKLVKEISNEK
jgi:hypothetical protein